MGEREEREGWKRRGKGKDEEIEGGEVREGD